VVGQKRNVTLRDVSKVAGLSLITISRALREPDSVKPETRKKIMQTIEEIGYVPNLTARSLVSQRSNMVGLVVPILTSSLFADLAQGIAGVMHDNDLQMLIAVSERSAERESEAVRTFLARQADAIIVTGFTHTLTCRKLLENFKGPIVETLNLRDEAVDLSVGYSNFDAAAEMTHYLIDKGYQEIAMVSGDFENNDQAIDRRDGFLSVMRAAGRTVRPEFIRSVPVPTTLENGRDIMMALIDGPVRPDVVFFQAEILAHGAVMACLACGLKMPEDIAVAGFGDLKLSALLPVPLTTIHVPSEEIGIRAARLVIDRLGEAEIQTAAHDVGYEIKVRQSA